MDSAEFSTSHYPLMKDSRVEWLGEIPVEWEVKKLKYLVSMNDESLPEDTDERFLIKYVDISNVKSGVGILSIEELSFSSAPSRARRIVREGDVIVSTVRTYLRSITKISNPPDNLIVSTGFAVIRPRRLNSDYTGYMFYSENLIGEIVSRSTGVSYPAINASDIGNIPVPVPTTDEQTAIANFLDRKTAEIDALIAQKERLLELYEEEKTAIINHSVTKGLDPNAELKDSGVEWLGEIPVGWEVKKLKHTANLKSGNNLTSDQIKENGEYPVYGGNGLRGYYNGFTHDGDFILIGRQGAYCGNINYGANKFWATEHAVVVEPLSDYQTVWMGEVLRVMNLNQYSVAAAQPGLSVEAICNLSIPWPLLEEQASIVEHIEAETARINAKIAKTQRIIELQKEYRTALISEVVTGKIKVPELPTQEASA